MINLKKQIILTSIVGLLALSFIASANGQNSAHLGLYEDQALVCIKQTEVRPFNEICKVVDILNLLDEKHESKLFAEFNGNQDVFDIESLD